MSRRILINKNVKISLEQAVEEYLEECRDRKLSPQTIRTYEQLKNLYKLLPVMEISFLDEQCIKDFLIAFRENHSYSDNSINNLIRYIKTFVKWCVEKEYLEKEIKINYLKVPSKIQEVPTSVEVKRMLTRPNLHHTTYNSFAGWLVTSIIVATGLRINAVSQLKRNDIDLKNNVLTVRENKGGKVHRIILVKKLKDDLKFFIEHTEEHEYLFANNKGIPYTGHTLSMVLVRYANSLGIDTSPHCLRRFFATEYIKNGGNIVTLSRLLLHSDLSITQKYLEKLTIQDMSDEIFECNPLSRL